MQHRVLTVTSGQEQNYGVSQVSDPDHHALVSWRIGASRTSHRLR